MVNGCPVLLGKRDGEFTALSGCSYFPNGNPLRYGNWRILPGINQGDFRLCGGKLDLQGEFRSD